MSMEPHIKLSSVLHIVIGGIGLCMGLVVLVAMGGITLLLGSAAGPQEAAIPVSLMMVIGIIWCGVIFITSIPGLLAGIGTLKGAPWARVLTIVISILYIPFNFPLGTFLGVYSLWVMFSPETEEWFKQMNQ